MRIINAHIYTYVHTQFFLQMPEKHCLAQYNDIDFGLRAIQIYQRVVVILDQVSSSESSKL